LLIKKEKIPVKNIVTVGILPSFLKKLYYSLKGYKIGKNVSVGMGSVIIGDSVVIGDNTKIGFMTVVRAKQIKIGRYVKIGSMTMIDTEKIEIDDDARINEQVIIGGIKNPDSFIKIGKRTIIMEYSFINPTKPIIIGDDTGIGGHCLLFTHGSWLSEIDGYPVTFAPITLGKKVWLPWRVFILPGVTIGDNVVIGADSLITKSLPSNCLAAGSPAKIIKENYPSKLTDDKRSDILNRIFADFIKYLEYHQYEVDRIEDNKNFKLIVKNKISTNNIFYNFEPEEMNPDESQNSAWILDYTLDNKTTVKFPEKGMILNLINKTRMGSTDVGEEFVRYISRYGIRFDRID
jgi:acetyltransferase-like isoleucine patch superfamily enzyme